MNIYRNKNMLRIAYCRLQQYSQIQQMNRLRHIDIYRRLYTDAKIQTDM